MQLLQSVHENRHTSLDKKKQLRSATNVMARSSRYDGKVMSFGIARRLIFSFSSKLDL